MIECPLGDTHSTAAGFAIHNGTLPTRRPTPIPIGRRPADNKTVAPEIKPDATSLAEWSTERGHPPGGDLVVLHNDGLHRMAARRTAFAIRRSRAFHASAFFAASRAAVEESIGNRSGTT